MDNLIFFDKEGNSLNFIYNETLERYEGDIIFHENSNDTFKTQALYLFEQIKSFQFENQEDLSLRKFQLFNEFGFHFYNAQYTTQSFTKIEPVNFETTYYSKWVYGNNFHMKFPIGTIIRFNNNIFEFNNQNQTYTVVSSKKGAIMIISLVDNDSFNSIYPWNTYNYTETISSVNILGIYDYVDSTTLQENLSNWNEKDFYNRIYKDRKLNIINTQKNDNYRNTNKNEDVDILTVKNENLIDISHHEYHLGGVNPNNNLLIEVITKTDLPIIYQGGISLFDSSSPLSIGGNPFYNVISFSGTVPHILKPGMEFKIDPSIDISFYTIGNIPTFVGNSNIFTYIVGSQVIWNNTVYQCTQQYTWNATSSITPDDSSYWGQATYLPLTTTPTPITTNTEIYLTKDHFYFTQAYTFSSTVTLNSAVEQFKGDLKSLNLDLYYKNNELLVDLIYPSQYAIVNFYGIASSFSPTSSPLIGYHHMVFERAIEIEENIEKEFNYDFSENFIYNIVFTDLDTFGLIIRINKMVYQEEVEFIYSFDIVDMQRTIDKTLRNWFSKNAIELLTLGIITNLQTIGTGFPYYNSIRLKTEYPNVPLDFKIEVGTTADFYIEHSKVLFFEPSVEGVTFSYGNYIDIRVNGRSYGVTHSLPYDGIYHMSQTLQKWIDGYQHILDDYGIFVDNSASSLSFNVKKQSQRCDIEIRTGSSVLPGDIDYKIIKKYEGNHGPLITSNEIILGSQSIGTPSYQNLENAGFATGMVTGINGAVYPLENTEFNILLLDPYLMNLSYEGPFWGMSSSLYTSSPFITSSFTIGFSQTASIPIYGTGLGMFSLSQFSSGYSVTSIGTSTYSVNNINGVLGMTAISYFQPTNSIFVLADDLLVYDSISSTQLATITLPGNANSRYLSFNSYDNYLYALSNNFLWKIDPYTNNLITISTFSEISYSIDFNRDNGDVYITTDTNILLYNNDILVQTISIPSFDLKFNNYEGDMYVATRNGTDLLRIDGSTRTLQTTYTVPGITSDYLEYDPINESIYVYGSNLYKVNAGTVTSLSPTTGSFNSLLFNNIISSINISNDSPEFGAFDVNTDSYNYNVVGPGYGYQAINYYDGDVYISNQDPITPSVIVMNTEDGSFNYIIPTVDPTTRLIYDPDRNSIWLLQPSLGNIIEIVPTISLSTTNYPIGPPIGITSSNYGTLADDYIERNYLWLHTRDYIRGPRFNFNGDPRGSFYWKWFSDNVPEFFLYDFSGDLLPTTGSLAYTGPKPLTTVHLNRNANRDPYKKNISEYQQTIFPTIEHVLDYIDDTTDVSIVPEPIQTFIGFNSQLEGGLRSILQLYKKEDVDFKINTSTDTSSIISFETITDVNDRYGLIKLDISSSQNFIYDSNGNPRGLKPGQHLAIFIKDESNTKKQYTSLNNGYLTKIRNVYFREIVVDFFKDVDEFKTESTIVTDFPKVGQTTYLSTRFKVWDREIGRFNVFGQTEIEDVRYAIELGNVGKLISSDDVYIFKEYDIKEGGIDWVYLNKKRKEMLMMKSLIYPYIGSYKAIINAINYFGYNDLELYEYYRNVNFGSKNYFKLFKVEIPDIFDNTVEGWHEGDFIKHTFPNDNYDDTNLFNLTYRITDREGNNILTYTLEEVQKKLQGLKYWLQKNIIPITHKILDITGRADIVSVNTISHITRDVNIIKVFENFTPVSFRLNELYLMPVNNGSTVYNCVLDFYINSGNSFYPQSLPSDYTVDIRTYEIYREWYAFKNYMTGDRIVYYDRLYESAVDNNKTNNPRKYESVVEWVNGTIYNVSDVVKYNREFYIYSGYGVISPTASIISPYLDNGGSLNNWINITEWKEIDLVPIQQITERRKIDNLYPFNFTIDSNIDPYLVIEVSSENGYGATYRDRKNYEIKGLLDLRELESFTNLTSKQYIDANLGTQYFNIQNLP